MKASLSDISAIARREKTRSYRFVRPSGPLSNVLKIRRECHPWRLTFVNEDFGGRLGDNSNVLLSFEIENQQLLRKSGAGDGNRTRTTSLGN
jgi:hypothetical protein